MASVNRESSRPPSDGPRSSAASLGGGSAFGRKIKSGVLASLRCDLSRQELRKMLTAKWEGEGDSSYCS
jgi:hypothetical protein